MKDDLQRWILLFASLTASLCAGFGYSWSIFMKPMMSTFKWSATDVSLSFTFLMATAAATAILAGKMIEYIKSQDLLFVGGILFGGGIALIGFSTSLYLMYLFTFTAGIGIGIVYPGATLSNIIRFFPDKRGMASGLLSAGFGLGPVVWAPVSVFLLENYGLMAALKILGIIFFVIISFMSRILRTAQNNYLLAGIDLKKNQIPLGNTDDVDWKLMIKTPVFYFLAVIFVLGTISGMMIIGHASPIVQEVFKVSAGEAGTVLGYLSIGIVLGKITWGIISDRIGRNAVFIILFTVAGLALGIMVKTNFYIFFVTAVCAIGFCYGGFLSLIGPVTADVFGQKHLGINLGIMFLTIAIAAFLGPWLASNIYQTHNHEYTSAFIIGGFINIAGFILAVCFIFFMRQKRIFTP